MKTKKILVLLLALICFSLTSKAQERSYGKFDFEIGLTTPITASSIEGYNNVISPGFYLEGRYQLNSTPIDLGLHIALSSVRREDTDASMVHSDYRIIPIMAIADYQFNRGGKFNPYVGVGGGVSLNTIVNEIGADSAKFIIAPRFGVRCFKFMNLGATYYITQKDYSRLSFNLGFYF